LYRHTHQTERYARADTQSFINRFGCGSFGGCPWRDIGTRGGSGEFWARCGVLGSSYFVLKLVIE